MTPRTEIARDDTGADTMVSSASVDLSSDVDAILPEREEPSSGLEEIPPLEPQTAGGEDIPPTQQNISTWGEEDAGS